MSDEKTINAEEPADLSVYVPEKVRKPGEIGFALIGIIFGLLGYYFALDMTHDTYSAPSVFPKIASVIIVLCGLVSLVKAVRREPPAVGETVLGYLLPKDVIFMLAMLLVYCFALPILHFSLASYAFMVIGMVYLHSGKQIIRSFVYSGIALAVLVAVFRYVFLVILP
jgi:hypothetical protein